MTAYDRRLTPARPDLAAEHLRGTVMAERFAPGVTMRVRAPIADLRRDPRLDVSIDTQALRGETITVYEEIEGWAWGQLDRDGYVGWMSSDMLAPAGEELTHEVSVLRTFLYPGPDLRFPVAGQLTEGARVVVTGRATTRNLDYALLDDGNAVVAGHLVPVGSMRVADYVTAAEAYLGTPYLWGGRTSLGIDCSGLVQTALARAGIVAPRDSDLQEATVGRPYAFTGNTGDLKRGDLMFWKGHVGIIADDGLLLHASGGRMATVFEPLDEAIDRIAATGLEVSRVRRL